MSNPVFAQSKRDPESVNDLPQLKGELTLYLGRGEGGLYENVLDAIQKRNPELTLTIRRGATAALANAIMAEAKAGIQKADLFWAVDSGAIGVVADNGQGQALPPSLTDLLDTSFQYPNWAPITGRIRTLPYNPSRVSADKIPDSVLALADTDLKLGWAPAYSSFQSFLTAMRIQEGDKVTGEWLKAINAKATKYAGELGVVMAVERGEVDLGFANHYYTLRLKAGKPDANVQLAFTKDDAGCLVNASGVMALTEGDLPINFVRYLLSKEVQSYLAREAYEIPLVNGIEPPAGIPPMTELSPPDIDLSKLSDLRPTLRLMRQTGVL
ncbi:substrate-binding domain-containing protein [Oceanobacter kriegii]|uniref:substrate-binding domain-containing protein n=1 Tax=Oceanobacter kriegii TaxID=64972 RepID=UPI001FE0C1F1|nr:substrate-binding domain-containing protein [Oceanobacter kriegii]